MAANTLISLVILVFFFYEQTGASRTTLLELAAASGAGICKLMVESNGYLCQEHTVTTKDGYILSLQRIPKGLKENATDQGRPPVLLQHGVLMDGVTWLLNPPEQSLAFILADNGYDVWIANSRGTQYSLAHTTLSSEDPAYWDWSWDELVAYDLPAMVQYVFHQSGQKLHYVGHSQGTLIAMAAFSKQQLLDMVRSAVLLSPVAYLSRMTSPLARNAVDNFLSELLYWSGLHQFEPRGFYYAKGFLQTFAAGLLESASARVKLHTFGSPQILPVKVGSTLGGVDRQAVTSLLKDTCKKPGIECTDLFTSFTGENCCLSTSIVNTFLEHEPQSTATKNMIHLAQMARDGTLAMYDYEDRETNIQRYGSSTPPEYNLTNIPRDLPLFLAHGGRDALSDVDDVKFLLHNLKTHDADKLFLQFIEEYAHADYIMAMNVKQLVYDPLISFFKLHE